MQGKENVDFLDSQLCVEGLKELDFESKEQLEDALLRREWRTINWIIPHAPKLAEDL